MKYKIFLFAILFVLTAHIDADSEDYFGLFTTFNPSAETIAFGNQSGTAYIWGNNPLNSWSNPALLAYNDGLSWGWSHDPWLDGFVDGIYMNSSYVSYANQNFGLLLPMLNASGNLGTTCDYGMQEAYDANGHLVSKFHSYEICSRFAVGKKLFHLNLLHNSGNSDSFTFSGGYDFRYITSNLPLFVADSLDRDIVHGTMHGLGLVGHFIHHQRLHSAKSSLTFEITSGLYQMNLFRNEMHYKSGDYPLPYGTRLGFTGKVSYDFGANSNISMPVSFMQSNLSLCLLYDTSKYADNPSTWGQGFEFGLFETLFLRWGKHHDQSGQERNTFGLGVKLNFSEVHFEYNYATFSIGSLDTTERKDDLMVSVDLKKVLKKK